MKVVHLMAGGNAAGGIETLMADYAKTSKNENIFLFAWGEGPSVEWIRSTGCQTIVFNSKVTGDVKMIVQAIKKINEIKPDYIIIQHATPELRLIGILLGKKYPVFVYHHCNAALENPFRGLRRIITDCIYRISVKTAIKNIAISQSVKVSVNKIFKVPDKKIEVIHNGINLAKFEPRDQRCHDVVKLIFVGRLVEGKGVQITLKALSHLPRTSNFKFLVVGDGDYRSALSQLAAEYSLESNVEFLGMRMDVPELLKESDIFIHVPLFEEGFGNVVVEAMACGKICICAKSGGIPEIINDGHDGYLIKKGDDKTLAEILSRLIQNYPTQETDALEANAIKKARMFDIQQYSYQLDNIQSES